MRLPKESQLSQEQKEVCYAPPEGTAIVVGPPGSGKTVAALFRVRSLNEGEHDVIAVMYNKVLKRYAGQSETFLSWIHKWWRESTRGSLPMSTAQNRSGFQPPDFDSAANLACSILRDKIKTKGHWGHLIMDEAQDFDPSAHRLLCAVQNVTFDHLPLADRPSILILADENQRITPRNSTIADLLDAYMIPREELYLLKRNYRNTREIAQFSAQFFNDAASGTPELPERRGDAPRVVVTADLNDAVERIVRHVRIHANQEIGVLVHYENTRRKIYNRLSHRLRDVNIPVQTYSSQDERANDEEALKFDVPRVTVLCYASSKGLEFDAVFLPELQSYPMDPENRDVAKMNLYVMASRARNMLTVMLTDPQRESPFWKMLRQSDKDVPYVIEE
jgi:DNA helicase IV